MWWISLVIKIERLKAVSQNLKEEVVKKNY